MLELIDTVSSSLLKYVRDDPVRPEIPAEFRVTNNRYILAITDHGAPCSMVCVSLHDFVPSTVEDLDKTALVPTTAVFYTIWSYKPGSGSLLLREGLNTIRARDSTVNTFVTLSPKTEMARKFHTKNGAIIFRENSDTINYQYLIYP
jgi:hypothetical protein